MNELPRGTRTVVAGALCAAAVVASLHALTGLISAGRWLPAAVVWVLCLAAVLIGVRALTRAWWAPTLAGTVVAGVAVLAVFASPPGRFQLVPSTDSLGRLGDIVRVGMEYVNGSRPPVDGTVPLELLVVGGALLVLLVTDLVALGLASPAWSGLGLLALWIPGVALDRPGSGWAFVGTAAAYLLLLAVAAAPAPGTRGGRGRGDARRRVGAALAGAAAVTVTAMVLGPVAGAAPGWSTIRLPQLGTVTGGSLQLADDLDMSESLGARSDEVVLTYQADPVPVGPLRLFTLRDFDGMRWSRDDDASDVAPDDDVLWPARDLQRPAGEAVPTVSTVTVEVGGLREERLPVPVMPRTVEADGRWTYDAARDEVVRVGVTRPGMVYTMEVQLLELTADGLRASDGDDPADMERYLAVPQTSRADEVALTAAEVTASADNRYEQALALQSYFRSSQNFTYDTDVPAARSDDGVWDFLGSRTGYCVQFATAMTVMARTLGIPARLAVGFLPGSLTDAGQYVVTGRDSHAWPELYYPDLGWIRFEPTPAVQSGAPPRWADPFAGAGAAPTREANPEGPGALPSTAATQAPQSAPAGGAQQADRGSTMAAAAAASVLALAGAVWVVRRRRSARAGDLSPEVAWQHLRTRLASAGITWSDARTPAQVVALVSAELARRNGSPMRPEAEIALRELAFAVQDDRYAPDPRDWEHGELENRVGAVLREVTSPTRVEVP
ncbi:DUF3488 and transglutaminase-like domain-containing protein [Cellulomonas fimi]|uniref:Transglutaminase domain-containing protein n=1 Tax=Cellulomonas fimi TaxID=1708 RepID=A0A7Y0LZ60_CELFI|nr:DUF3488 and transglutaminase-like domain-containing protein [Cellulomonas fimi]NMR20619.1 transglutaminase domain-containing protein [Cellulomonas fimi]